MLSARTSAQLVQKVTDLHEFIARQTHTPDLLAMAYTLQVGREAMEERVGFIVSSVSQLSEALAAYIDDAQSAAFRGQVKANKASMSVISQDDDMLEAIQKWIARKKFAKLLDLWVKGLRLDWHALYAANPVTPRFIVYWLYPFAKERYWVNTETHTTDRADSKTINALHPLVHENHSDLHQLSYRSYFSAQDALCEPQLNAFVLLDMALAAANLAAPIDQHSTQAWQVEDVHWGIPFIAPS